MTLDLAGCHHYRGDMFEFRFSSRSYLAAISLLACLAFPSACKVDDDGGGGGDTTEGMTPCPECEEGQDVFACLIDGNEELFCFESLEVAQQSCGGLPGNGVVGNGPTTCDNQTAGVAEKWSPTEYVTYESETHVIERGFFGSVLEHPDLLLLDDARVRWTGKHLEFETVEPGDLAHALGFADGDVLVSVNDYELATVNDLFAAFDALYGSQEFVVEVLRGDETLVLRYALR